MISSIIFNNTEVKPAVLDGGHVIVLANWPNSKHVICNDKNNILVKIPSHPYVLINGTVLCNCGIEAEDNFLLESIAAYPGKQSDLTMYFTVNMAFMHYFDSLTNTLGTHISKNWTTREQVLPISLQMRWPQIYFKGLTHYYYFVCIHIFMGLTHYNYQYRHCIVLQQHQIIGR